MDHGLLFCYGSIDLKILCLGASFTGKFLARNFVGKHKVAFLTRKPSVIKIQGFHAIDSNFPIDCYKPDLILDTIPPILNHNKELLLPYEKEIEGVSSTNIQPLYLHISSTSVYATEFTSKDQGELPIIDEDTPVNPQRIKGENRLKLENKIQNNYSNSRIIRAGGIYGPNRSLVNSFMDGNFSRVQAGNKLVSRIHVMDLCRLILSFSKADLNLGTDIVNGVDTLPSANKETFRYIETITGIYIPGNWDLDIVTGRKVISKYSGDLLDNKYVFPTFREGFLDCMKYKE